jgi:two-component system LytT family response regulator
MLKTIIIDDEISGRNILKNFVSKYCPEKIEIIAEADSVKTGINQITIHNPDLVLLDVQMQDGTGFDLLELLPNISFKVIFITSYDKFAIRAFKYSAIDYILKPVDPDLLVAAINRIADKNVMLDIDKKLDVLISNKNNIEKIALPATDGIRFLKINEIIRCESDSNYTTFFTINKEKIVVSKTLKEYEVLLSSMKFYRIHKSHLVNLRYISKYVPGEGGYVIMEDKTEVEVSRRKKEGLLTILMNQI